MNVRVDCGDERAEGVKDKTGPTTRGYVTTSMAFISAFSVTTTTHYFQYCVHLSFHEPQKFGSHELDVHKGHTWDQSHDWLWSVQPHDCQLRPLVSNPCKFTRSRATWMIDAWGHIGAKPLWNLVSWATRLNRKEKRSRHARDDGVFILHVIFTFDSMLSLQYSQLLLDLKVETVALVEKYSARRGVLVESWRSIPIC